MDSLALLCNLYGDGPTTLRRLRDAGFGSLEAVAGLEPEALAGLLRTSLRAAQRFHSEGRLLLARLEPQPVPEAEPGPPDEGASDPLLSEVLAAWRERDAADEQGERDEPEELPAPPAPLVSGATGAQRPERARPAGATATREAPQEGLLRAGALDGLDVGLCARLARVGVRRLVELARGDAFEISRAAGLPYTRILRLAQLARRDLGSRAVEADEATRAPDTLWPRPGPRPRQAPRDEPPPAREDGEPRERFSPSFEPAPVHEGPLEEELGGLGGGRRRAATRPPASSETPEAAGPFA